MYVTGANDDYNALAGGCVRHERCSETRLIR